MRQQLDTGTPLVLATVEDRVGCITLNNPARKNAMTAEMFEAIPRAVDAVSEQGGSRVIVLRGAGDEAFASGADISSFGEHRTTEDDRREFDGLGQKAMEAVAAASVPVIAMIRGWCLGGGLLLALQADFRVCDSSSRLGIPTAKLGAGYKPSSVRQLVAHVGASWAAEILFTARYVDAAEAERIGLVNRSVPPEDLEAEIARLTTAIVANAPLTIRSCKMSIAAARAAARAMDADREDSLEEAFHACFRSQDYREGQQAFLEKRAPRFTGT